MGLSRKDLLRAPRAQLDAWFAEGEPEPIPDGEGTGSALIATGTWLAPLCAWLQRWLWWQGKVFDRADGSLKNRVSPFSLLLIKAKVYRGASWFDRKDCIVIDYSKTSLVARMVRDEIRLVAPGLYLGKVFLWGRPSIHFCVSYQYEPARRLWRRVVAGLGLALLVLALWAWARFTSDRAVTYDDPVQHFQYGSTGGERGSGIPLSVWKALPEIFSDLLPGEGYESLGFVREPGKELPIGVSQRRVQGVDRVFLNCAACHVGTVRDSADGPRRIITGMGSNTIDLQGFQRFLAAAARDERFTAERILPVIEGAGTEGWLNRQLLRWLGIPQMRARLLTIDQRFRFMEREPEAGPGRFDTFNPSKVLLNFPMEKLPEREWVGLCDFPSIWNQGQREERKMWLHWDGNNNSVRERNRSAAFGTGARPPTLDRESLARMEQWLLTAKPPAYPYPIDAARAERGAAIYREYCADCHGASGTDFAGERVGRVTPIAEIGTDRWRLDSYSRELCASQGQLYAGYGEERFHHFRKTDGYANAPLDGLWLRAPYLHNGSVPTLRDLLEPAGSRPAEFYRGYDVFDPVRVGYVSDVAEENGRTFFLFRTVHPAGTPQAGQAVPGNGNFGHEGPAYGTELSPADKEALIEHLKTF